MPHKYNADRRRHILKMSFKVRNWPAYEARRRRRGSLTLWIEDAALGAWQSTGPGGQARYTDAAIEVAVGRWKQVIGHDLRTHQDKCRATEVEVAVYTLGCLHAQSYVGVRMPEIRPHRLTPNGVGATAPKRLIGAPRCHEANASDAIMRRHTPTAERTMIRQGPPIINKRSQTRT